MRWQTLYVSMNVELLELCVHSKTDLDEERAAAGAKTIEQLKLQRHGATRQVDDVEFVISSIGGTSWRFRSNAQATGAELRARAAYVAQIQHMFFSQFMVFALCLKQFASFCIHILENQAAGSGGSGGV